MNTEKRKRDYYCGNDKEVELVVTGNEPTMKCGTEIIRLEFQHLDLMFGCHQLFLENNVDRNMVAVCLLVTFFFYLNGFNCICIRSFGWVRMPLFSLCRQLVKTFFLFLVGQTYLGI